MKVQLQVLDQRNLQSKRESIALLPPNLHLNKWFRAIQSGSHLLKSGVIGGTDSITFNDTVLCECLSHGGVEIVPRYATGRRKVESVFAVVRILAIQYRPQKCQI